MVLITEDRRRGERRARGRNDRRRHPLRECVRDAIETYFNQMDGHKPTDLYKMVLDEVEAPLLEAVLRETRGNHSSAATLLGINRGTLRKKLKHHQLL